MEMTSEQRVLAPQTVVWKALNDPEVLAACIPGCETVAEVSDAEFNLVMRRDLRGRIGLDKEHLDPAFLRCRCERIVRGHDRQLFTHRHGDVQGVQRAQRGIEAADATPRILVILVVELHDTVVAAVDVRFKGVGDPVGISGRERTFADLASHR